MALSDHAQGVTLPRSRIPVTDYCLHAGRNICGGNMWDKLVLVICAVAAFNTGAKAVKKNCEPPPDPPNTDRNICDPPYINGDICEYECSYGYSKVSGDDWLVCYDGVWHENQLVCKKDCYPAPYPFSTNRNGCTPPYRHGDVCNYECFYWYSKVFGDNALTCNDGEWEGNELFCMEDCDPPPNIPNTYQGGSNPPYRYGDECHYDCSDGFSKVSGDNTLICDGGVWEGNTLVCKHQCSVDLIFLIDGSSSIGRDGFEKAKEYISYIIGCFSNGNVNVGVIQYERTPKVDIPLGSHMDTVGLQDAIISDVFFSGGQGRTGAAIRCMTTVTPFREQARKVAVVATDGSK
ncbi:complement factor H-like isoform X1 [Branchiostoma lanceolatum]|uniref:complement factor H-like isoform X1 n=2 Tax=Branchiostoma lanceolatum TaxID=7740 RepID=UPI003453C7FB